MFNNFKVIINKYTYDIDGFSLSRRLYFLLDGRIVGFDDVNGILKGSGLMEYQYNKFITPKEIFEGDILKFFDKFNNILTGEVFFSDKRLQWLILCDENIHGWHIHNLCDAGTPTIVKRKFEEFDDLYV
ncbi:MAG: hypothetical protein LBD46_07860 [Endomicrobium sp.]|jgi:hypothetical protein|nr:hypothetical protein [Endomicrobium sp.]